MKQRNNTIRNFVMRKAVMLLALILTTNMAWADGAKKLPYTYGFENNDLAAEGWTTVNIGHSSGISSNYDDSYRFGFQNDGITSGPQYLISPEIDSEGNGYKVSFSYSIRNDNNPIQVGYSTTTNDLSAFTTWDAEISGYHEGTLYEKEVPAGTKYIAIKCTVSNNPGNYVDDFTFVASGCFPPENLEPSDITDQSATLTWTAPATSKTITGYAYQYKKVSETEWSAETTVNAPAATSATIISLTANTSYEFRIKTLYVGSEASDYATITILTDCSAVSLPISENFNYSDGLGCWRIVNGHYNTGILSDNTFCFYGDAHQYLMSPQVSSGSALTVSFKYKPDGVNHPKTFQVGCSSTTDATTAFDWETAITADNASEWTTYEHTFPAGTKYFAIEYLSDNDLYGLIIDDFCIIVNGALPPAQLSASNILCQSVTLTWTAPSASVTNYAYQYKKTSDGTWSDEATTTDTSVTISELTADTDYDFRVRAIYGSDYSIYTTVGFTTATALPYEFGFEDGMGRWSMVDCNVYPYVDYTNEFGVDFVGYTGRKTKAAHDGAVGFQYDNWSDSEPKIPQYLISPRFSGTVPMAVSFYYRVPTNIAETIQVGYSTTTNDIFTFVSEITTNSSDWTKYEYHFPAGTKYIAISYTSNYYELYLDDFSFRPMTSVTFAKEGFGTYYDSSLDLVLPSGVKAYVVTETGDGQALVHLKIADGDTPSGNVVPKGTAVILQTGAGTEIQNIDVTLATPSATAISETNLLHGSDVAVETSGGGDGAKYFKLCYGAADSEFASVLGWFWGAADGAAFESAAHKAWLALPGSMHAPARGYIGLPGDDGTTGIIAIDGDYKSAAHDSGIANSLEQEAWYSIDGRRLSGKPSAKGVYVHNGRKEVIR